MPTTREVIQSALELRRTERSAERAWNIAFLRSKRSNVKDCILQKHKRKPGEKRVFSKDTEQNGITTYSSPQHTLFKAERLKKEVPRGYLFPHRYMFFSSLSHICKTGVIIPPSLCCGLWGLHRKKCLIASAPRKPFSSLSWVVLWLRDSHRVTLLSLPQRAATKQRPMLLPWNQSGASFWPRFN